MLSNGSNLSAALTGWGDALSWRDPVLSQPRSAESRFGIWNLEQNTVDELKERCRRSNRGALIPTGISTRLREIIIIITHMERRRRGKGA